MKLSLLIPVFVVLFCFVSHAMAVDTDGDGRLDVMDVPGFDPSSSNGRYDNRGIEDLDGVNQLSKVSRLSLSRNQITSIESGDFGGLSNLERLYLDRNRITSIEKGDFDGLRNLETLRLGGNQIANIEPGAFDELEKLKGLDLRHNRIANIEPGIFEGLSNLKSLWLSDIMSIESGDFDGLDSLEKLTLSRNQITSIESGDFDGLDNLEALYVRDNPITSIGKGGFDGLSNLKYLNLYRNQIRNIEPGAFREMTKLEWLSFLWNPIEKANFAQAKFHSLDTSTELARDRHLILDDAELNEGGLEIFLSQISPIYASLVGLRFSHAKPEKLLVSWRRLDHLTVDQHLYDSYTDELDAFASEEGHTLCIIGYGDANRDGIFDSHDIVQVFQAGGYEDGIAGNSYWTSGDWDSDGDFDSSDLVIASQAVPIQCEVPEPSVTTLLILGIIGMTGLQKRIRSFQRYPNGS